MYNSTKRTSMLLPSVKDDNMTQKPEKKTGWGRKGHNAYVCGIGEDFWNCCLR